MFNFNRKKTVNLLTHLFDNDRVPKLDEVLLCTDLSISIRYEVPELIEYIFPPNTPNSPIFDQILDLCIPLSTKSIKTDDIRMQRNASNLLSTICNPLQKIIAEDRRLELRLKDFISKGNKYATNSTFSGHFSRIAETYIRYTKGKFFEQNNDFIKELMRHINILSYKNLLVSLVAEFYQNINDNWTSEKTVFIYIANELNKSAGKKDEWLKSYNIFSVIVLILQQQDPTFVSNFDNYQILFQLITAAMKSIDNTIVVFESFRCIDYIASMLTDRQNLNKAKDDAFKLNKEFFQSKSKVSIKKKYAAFKLFWEEAIKDMIVYFFSESPNTFFCNSVIEVLSNISAEKRIRYLNELNIFDHTTKYWEKNKKLEKNFSVIKLILIFAAELKPDEVKLYRFLGEEEYANYRSKKWMKIVFEAYKLMGKTNMYINESKNGDY